MLFLLKKKMYEIDADFIVFNEKSGLVCKIARLKKGFYIYNRKGEQIAQITFHKNTAKLAVASPANGAPTVATLMIGAKNQFVFLKNIYEKSDAEYVGRLRGQNANEFSIHGKVDDYSFDVFDGPELVANFVPTQKEPDYYYMDMQPHQNILYAIMIAVAAERLNFDPLSKLK